MYVAYGRSELGAGREPRNDDHAGIGMQVTVETAEGLERRMKVQVPEERVKGEVDKRLKDLAAQVRVPGFRPGKVPRKILAQRFGRQVRDEVVGELLQSSFLDAVEQEQLNIAGPPRIEPDDVVTQDGIEFIAVFDVYPEIEPPAPESINVERPSAEVASADVDRMLETLRKQRQNWETVERAAADGDRVVIDFSGTVDGVELDQSQGTEVPIEIGSGRMIPGFEDGLVGTSAGDEITLNLSFPEDYHAADLAGKPVVFTIKAHRVEEGVLPEIDDEFAVAFGIKEGGVAALREEVQNNMERELSEALRNRTKQRVMDALLDGGEDFDVPQHLVDEESQRSVDRRKAELAQHGIDPAKLPLESAMFSDEAKRRVALGLLLGELIKRNQLEVDTNKVRERIETIASTYEDPDEVIGWYYSQRERLSEIESAVLEDQVVDWVLERANVSEEATSFDALLNPGQTSPNA